MSALRRPGPLAAGGRVADAVREGDEDETAADLGVARGRYADAVCVRVLNADPFDETRS